MSGDREQELQDTILRQSSEIEVLKKQVRGLRADLEHATGDAFKALAKDVKRSRAILEALNRKMKLPEVDDAEGNGSQEG